MWRGLGVAFVRSVYFFSHYILSLGVLDSLENLQIERSETELSEEGKIGLARNFEIQHFFQIVPNTQNWFSQVTLSQNVLGSSLQLYSEQFSNLFYSSIITELF